MSRQNTHRARAYSQASKASAVEKVYNKLPSLPNANPHWLKPFGTTQTASSASVAKATAKQKKIPRNASTLLNVSDVDSHATLRPSYEMSLDYEELDYRPTSMGDLMLRRRRTPMLPDVDIFEVKLGEYFLMSSLFHEAERQLATLALAEIEGASLDVVVGGLGLGYTAGAALEESKVSKLVVVEYLQPVIEWHQQGLVPLGKTLSQDPRCHLQHSDFFALSADAEKSFDLQEPDKKHDAILLDIDHTPTNVLRQTNTRFYTAEGLAEARKHLRPGGIFALWADREPEDYFTERLASVFHSAEAKQIDFPNPLTGGKSCGTVYLARA